MSLRRLGAGCRPRTANRGFTLVELVVVLVLVAILSGMAAARFANSKPFAVQAAADQLTSVLRTAQLTAVAQRRSVYVVLGANPASASVCLDASCTQPLTPVQGSAWLEGTQDLRLDGSHSFSFAASGAPSFGSTLSVRVSTADGSVTSQTVTVEKVTGHVHLQ